MPQFPLSEAATAWVTVYLVASGFNWICLGCNRTMLLISRSAGVEHNRVMAVMAPGWYYPLTWLTTIAKFLSLIAIASTGGFILAVGLWIVQFMASVLTPIPFKTFYAGTLKRAVLGRPLHPDRLRAQFWLKEFGFGDLHPSPPGPSESPSPKGNAVVGEEPEREAGDGEWCDICTCRVTPDDDNRCPDCKWPL